MGKILTKGQIRASISFWNSWGPETKVELLLPQKFFLHTSPGFLQKRAEAREKTGNSSMSNGKHAGGDQLLLGQRHITPLIFLDSSLTGALSHRGRTSITASWTKAKIICEGEG